MNETGTDSAWREVAWNGVRFETPATWVPASIGSRYLLFEDRSGPTLEIRWEPVRGKFSHAAQLKRLSAGRGRKPSRPAAAVDLPASWAAALNRFEAAGFSWCGERLGAQGAILYCPVCRQASLIQLFRQGKGLRRRDTEHILTSLRDHVDGEWVFEPIGNGTNVTWRWTIHPRTALTAPLLPVFGKLWKGYARQSLEELSRQLVG